MAVALQGFTRWFQNCVAWVLPRDFSHMIRRPTRDKSSKHRRVMVLRSRWNISLSRIVIGNYFILGKLKMLRNASPGFPIREWTVSFIVIFIVIPSSTGIWQREPPCEVGQMSKSDLSKKPRYTPSEYPKLAILAHGSLRPRPGEFNWRNARHTTKWRCQ